MASTTCAPLDELLREEPLLDVAADKDEPDVLVDELLNDELEAILKDELEEVLKDELLDDEPEALGLIG